MKLTRQLIAATFALTAATGAFAGSDDGNSDNAWLKQATAQVSADAPAAAAQAPVATPKTARDFKVTDDNNQVVSP